MSFGLVEIALCVVAFVVLGGFFLGKSDKQDDLEEEWEGVVERVLIHEVVAAAHDGRGHAPIRSYTESILYCKRENGALEEFALDEGEADYEELSTLKPGTKIRKAAGESLPRPFGE
jgi:hypothetical protein